MSSALTSSLTSSPNEATSRDQIHEDPRAQATGRSAGKGRRRRAAAEQRRIEMQRLGESFTGDDEIAPPPPMATPGLSRRRSRRAQRRGSGQEELEDYLSGYDTSADPCQRTGCRGEDFSPQDLDLALAISLSLTDSSEGTLAARQEAEASIGRHLDLSYENLVKLENVVVAAPEDVVELLPQLLFGGHEEGSISEEICPICQGEFVEKDVLVNLPCLHLLHHQCAKEWLLHYSKACPVCKCDICT